MKETLEITAVGSVYNNLPATAPLPITQFNESTEDSDYKPRPSQFWIVGDRHKKRGSNASRELIREIISKRKIAKERNETTTRSEYNRGGFSSPRIFITEPNEKKNSYDNCGQLTTRDCIRNKHLLCVTRNNFSEHSYVANVAFHKETSHDIERCKLLNTQYSNSDKMTNEIEQHLINPIPNIKNYKSLVEDTLNVSKPTKSVQQLTKENTAYYSGTTIFKDIFSDKIICRNPKIHINDCSSCVDTKEAFKSNLESSVTEEIKTELLDAEPVTSKLVTRRYQFPKREFLKANSLPAFSAKIISQANRRKSMNTQSNTILKNVETENKCAKVQLFIKLSNCKLPNI